MFVFFVFTALWNSSDCCFYHFPFAYCCNYRRVYFIMFCSATSLQPNLVDSYHRRRQWDGCGGSFLTAAAWWCLPMPATRFYCSIPATSRPPGPGPGPKGRGVRDALFKSRRVLYCFSFCILMSLFLRSCRFYWRSLPPRYGLVVQQSVTSFALYGE